MAKICSLVNVASSHSAARTSCTFRRSVRCGVRNRFLASCWVMVEPPWRMVPARKLAIAARAMAHRSPPPCSKNRRDRLHQSGRQVLEPDAAAVEIAVTRQHRAVGRHQLDRWPPRRCLEPRDLGQVPGIPCHHYAERQGEPDRHDDGPFDHASDPATRRCVGLRIGMYLFRHHSISSVEWMIFSHILEKTMTILP